MLLRTRNSGRINLSASTPELPNRVAIRPLGFVALPDVAETMALPGTGTTETSGATEITEKAS